MQQRKFLAQPLHRQHSYAARLVAQLYQTADLALQYHYVAVCEWLGWPPLDLYTSEALSNRYHEHIAQRTQKLREDQLLPVIRSGDRTSASPLLPITVYLDHLRSAHNVGSIFRTVEAFRLGEIALSLQTPDPTHRQVERTAMGATALVPWTKVDDIAKLPRPIVALETAATALPLADCPFPERFTLVVGNEEYGCSEAVLAVADRVVEIPLVGHKNSLNVANALAIAAAEISRRLR